MTGAPRGGFTIVEVLIAVMLLTVGAMALVGTSALVTRRVGRGRMVTVAMEVANQRLEMLRRAAANRGANGLPCTSPSFASSAAPVRVGGVTESWTVADSGSVRTVTQNITYPTARGDRSFSVVTVIGCYK